MLRVKSLSLLCAAIWLRSTTASALVRHSLDRTARADTRPEYPEGYDAKTCPLDHTTTILLHASPAMSEADTQHAAVLTASTSSVTQRELTPPTCPRSVARSPASPLPGPVMLALSKGVDCTGRMDVGGPTRPSRHEHQSQHVDPRPLGGRDRRPGPSVADPACFGSGRRQSVQSHRCSIPRLRPQASSHPASVLVGKHGRGNRSVQARAKRRSGPACIELSI